MTDQEWKHNACGLCYVNCGVEVKTDGRSITRVRGDKAHPHSAGYICQKAQRSRGMATMPIGSRRRFVAARTEPTNRSIGIPRSTKSPSAC